MEKPLGAQEVAEFTRRQCAERRCSGACVTGTIVLKFVLQPDVIGTLISSKFKRVNARFSFNFLKGIHFLAGLVWIIYFH